MEGDLGVRGSLSSSAAVAADDGDLWADRPSVDCLAFFCAASEAHSTRN